jgi:hypothetical protein
MADHPEEQFSVKDYLLGQLSEQDRRRVEERLLADDNFFEEVSIAEEELTEQYLDGSLGPREAKRFREHFLVTPERRQSLRFAKTLRRYVDEHETHPHYKQEVKRARPGDWLSNLFTGGRVRWAAPALVTALAVVLAYVAWARFVGGRGDSPLTQEVARLNGPGSSPPAPAASLTLNSGRNRQSGEVKTLAPTGAGVIQLRLVVPPDEYRDYAATLAAVGGPAIVSVNRLSRASSDGLEVVTLNLPARLLRRSDYEIELSGSADGTAHESVGVYFFRVTGE